MIKPKENELLYSVFARWQRWLGYNKTTMNEFLYIHPKQKPNPFFINQLNSTILEEMQEIKPIKDWIAENTMFSVYGKVIPEIDREKAFQSLVTQDYENYRKYLYLPKVADKHLKYCPLCCSEKGEYWDIRWQLPEIQICTEHKCFLINADDTTTMQQKMPLGFYIPSEHIHKEVEVVYCHSPTIISVAEKMVEVYQKLPPPNFSLQRLLFQGLDKYRRGFMLQISDLHRDMESYYDHPLSKPNIQSVCNGKQYNFVTACYLLDFLGLSLDTPIKESIMPITEKKRIYSLIAKESNISESLVEQICKKYECLNTIEEHFGGSRRKYNYTDLDDLYENRVKELCKTVYENGDKVTYALITRELHLPDQQIKKLPKCRKIVESYHETKPEYQCRKLTRILKTMEPPYTISKVIAATHMKREYLVRCYNFPDLDPDVKEILSSIL